MGLTDEQIEALIRERKRLPTDYLAKLASKPKTNRRHIEAELQLTGDEGHHFVLATRKHVDNPKSFSVMLRYIDERTNKQYILMRCNGSSHDHTNSLEHQTIKGCHIHIAKERYMELKESNASYAEATTEYVSFNGAMATLIRRCGFRVGKISSIYDEFGVKP